MPYLIDGHNLIAHLPEIELNDPNDEALLVLLLRSYCARTGKKIVVVFDHGLPGGKSRLSTKSVQVVFATAQKTTADRIIMERIRSTRDVKGWVVVSSDEEVLLAAESAGMGAMRCQRFARTLVRPPKEDNHPGIRQHLILTEAEISEWMDIFGVDADEVVEAPVASEEKPPISHREDPMPPEAPASSQTQTSADTTSPKKAPASNDVDAWLEAFGGEKRKPTDPRKRIQPRGKPKPKPRKASDGLPEVDAESGEADDVRMTRNTVDAWMKLFGGEPSPDRQPTDISPERNKARKQGRYRNAQGKREPTVHKRMSTSEEIYLNPGEVDAWMDVFGVTDEEDEDET
jgi:predicted RNA-binding protein with PIN domain